MNGIVLGIVFVLFATGLLTVVFTAPQSHAGFGVDSGAGSPNNNGRGHRGQRKSGGGVKVQVNSKHHTYDYEDGLREFNDAHFTKLVQLQYEEQSGNYSRFYRPVPDINPISLPLVYGRGQGHGHGHNLDRHERAETIVGGKNNSIFADKFGQDAFS